MTWAVPVRFLTTLAGAGAGMFVGAVAGVAIYEVTMSSDGGFEVLSGALAGGPIGLYVGSLVGNWIGRLVHPAERLRTRGRRGGLVMIEGIAFSTGILIPYLMQVSGGIEYEAALILGAVGGVGGFAAGVLLADRLPDRGTGAAA
jgi:hypothetical protein